MKKAYGWVLFLGVPIFLSMNLWAAQNPSAEPSKSDLKKARQTYQEAVAQHGIESSEARAARQALRQARQTYHSKRRLQAPPKANPKH